MCKICVEWEKGKMTSKEALRAAGEIIGSTNEAAATHAASVVEKILRKEVPEPESDEEIDEEWERKNRGGY
jgi:hypothetical protein